jgi:hypothetical protein
LNDLKKKVREYDAILFIYSDTMFGGDRSTSSDGKINELIDCMINGKKNIVLCGEFINLENFHNPIKIGKDDRK